MLMQIIEQFALHWRVLFDTALQKIPSVQINLWRGVNVDISKNYKEDNEVTWWYFNSCSSSTKVVKNFLGSVSTLFMIEAKTAKDISMYSNFPDEKEVILGLGTRLCVVNEPLDHSTLNVVHLRELTDHNENDFASCQSAATTVTPKPAPASKYILTMQHIQSFLVDRLPRSISNQTNSYYKSYKLQGWS